jgi:hypothetical protein
MRSRYRVSLSPDAVLVRGVHGKPRVRPTRADRIRRPAPAAHRSCSDGHSGEVPSPFSSMDVEAFDTDARRTAGVFARTRCEAPVRPDARMRHGKPHGTADSQRPVGIGPQMRWAP